MQRGRGWNIQERLLGRVSKARIAGVVGGFGAGADTDSVMENCSGLDDGPHSSSCIDGLGCFACPFSISKPPLHLNAKRNLSFEHKGLQRVRPSDEGIKNLSTGHLFTVAPSRAFIRKSDSLCDFVASEDTPLGGLFVKKNVSIFMTIDLIFPSDVLSASGASNIFRSSTSALDIGKYVLSIRDGLSRYSM